MQNKKTWQDYVAVINLGALLIGGTWVFSLEHASNAVQTEQIIYSNKRIDEIAASQIRLESKINEIYKIQNISFEKVYHRPKNYEARAQII